MNGGGSHWVERDFSNDRWRRMCICNPWSNKWWWHWWENKVWIFGFFVFWRTNTLFANRGGFILYSQVVQVIKNPPVNAGDAGDAGSVPGLERVPGGENDNPLQYPCLKNPMDRGAWWVTVCGVAKSRTRLSDWTELNWAAKHAQYLWLLLSKGC